LVSDQLDRSLNSLSRSTLCFSEPWELSAARRSLFQRFTEVIGRYSVIWRFLYFRLFRGPLFEVRFYSLMVTSVRLSPSPVAKIEFSLSFLPSVQGHSTLKALQPSELVDSGLISLSRSLIDIFRFSVSSDEQSSIALFCVPLRIPGF